jgi:hypothetical protein
MQNYQSLSLPGQYKLYQAVAAQDNHSVWHRATILGRLILIIEFFLIIILKILILIRL